MSSSPDYAVGEETTEMLGMKLNFLAGKLGQREQELPALAADVHKKLAGNVSDAERQRQEKRASEACHRIRTMQREYDDLWQRWFRMMKSENADGEKLELEHKKNEEMRLELEERWEMLDRTGDYFKTRWG
ncbi:hypothetical protein FSPOR_4716 [Fusarium sporotrichioides]|uniref:Uncharacterized protein n=1 Tax=Fusarium sporotrichioides TaxID=5514 RepID=A0A395SB23_FUSSP|nr:hypothetical protein FSPOR_4716 [Fusarium sporotrichioides]